jgi:hypothetical protein
LNEPEPTQIYFKTNKREQCDPPNGYPRHASSLGSFLARQESRHGQPSVIADVGQENIAMNTKTKVASCEEWYRRWHSKPTLLKVFDDALTEATPPFYRGLGTLLLVFSVFGAELIRDFAKELSQKHPAVVTPYDYDRQWRELYPQDEPQRFYNSVQVLTLRNTDLILADIGRRNLFETLFSSRLTAMLGAASSLIISFSFFIEARVKRKKHLLEIKAQQCDPPNGYPRHASCESLRS